MADDNNDGKEYDYDKRKKNRILNKYVESFIIEDY